MSWLMGAWDRLDDDGRTQWTGVAMALALFGVHFTLWSPWLIEDAAISYSYALHAATGEGWVTYPGGEWVEGFSNPTWTALLATLRVFWISPFLAAPWLGLIFGALTLPLAFLWAREITGDRGLLPVVAPLFLATSPQFVTWCGSGLENPLWVWFMALGSLLFLRELRTGGVPWSALPFGLLAITRPEGPLYVATLAATGAVLAFRRNPRHLARIALWVGLCASVWFAYEAYRYTVFGWPLPNTYYAKLDNEFVQFQPWAWGTRDLRLAWPYLRNWTLWTAMCFVLPFFPLAATGLKGWRGKIGIGFTVLLIAVLIPGTHWLTELPLWPFDGEPETLTQLRVVLILAGATLVPWIGLGRDGDEARLVAWTLVATLFGFALYAGSDWMKGFRWLNHCIVPLSVLLADVVVAAANAFPEREPRWVRRAAFAVFAGIPLCASAVHSGYLMAPTETTPFDVGRRVFYFNQVQERLHLDHVTHYDIDMGANMWWGGRRLIDVGGLVDVPIARHNYEAPFIRDYLLREERPHFMHAHANWMAEAGLQFQPVFKREWIPIAHFVAGPAYMHIGNYLRKDVIFRPKWAGVPDRVDFGEALRLEGLDTPSPTVLPGGILYVEVGWRARKETLGAFRPVLTLSRGDQRHSWELPPAYDWVDPRAWNRREVVHGTHSLTLPEGIEEGDWDLVLTVYDRAGVWPASRAEGPPAMARGEMRWSSRIRVAPESEVLARVGERHSEVLVNAGAGSCEGAESALKAARRHLPKDHPAQPWAKPDVHRAIARCWAKRAETLDDAGAGEAIKIARLWDFRDPEVRAIATELADRWEAEGDAFWAEERPSPAYNAWARALLADPARPLVRKRAEEARSVRLGLVGTPETARR